EFTLAGFGFLLFLILVARPAAVFIATAASDLNLREKAFLAFFAPRGFVTAGVSSLFLLELVDVNYPQAERLVYLTFLIILGTVAVYGVCAPTLARLFGVADESPHGVLVLGGHDWARAIARELGKNGFRCLIVDSNEYNVLAARRESLPARDGDVFSDETLDEIVLEGFGRFLALTSNDEVNTLAALHFSEYFGRDHVFQLGKPDSGASSPGSLGKYRNRLLFGKDVSFDTLEERTNRGDVIRSIRLPADIDPLTFEERYGRDTLVLFSISKAGDITPSTAEHGAPLGPNYTVICVIDAETDEKLRRSDKVVSLDYANSREDASDEHV
ncbi:MAG: NAD-binding protein, partial [Deltaproteobacteria bacterium]|nr:NAD-binding protein [Deltaproteobacteria bacterium]